MKALPYLITALALIALGAYGWIQHTARQRDNARSELRQAQSEIDQITRANSTLTASISALQAEQERQREYAQSLSEDRQKSEQKATEAIRKYREAVKADPSVKGWADEPLPRGIY